jgi:hypothetical protein
MQLLVPHHVLLVHLARHPRSARPFALHALLALTQVPPRVSPYSALLATMQLLVPHHALLVHLARYPRSARRLALHALLALTQVPPRVSACSALQVTMQLLVPLAHLVYLAPTLQSLDLQRARHAPKANSLALDRSPAVCALLDSQSCRSVSRHHVWFSPKAT